MSEGTGEERMQQLRQIEEMKRQLLSSMLTKEAFERLSRVRMVNPDTAGQLELYLVQLYQTGKFQEKITDERLREVLKALASKRQVRIKRV
jgi:programmed cell death protein 5